MGLVVVCRRGHRVLSFQLDALLTLLLHFFRLAFEQCFWVNSKERLASLSYSPREYQNKPSSVLTKHKHI